MIKTLLRGDLIRWLINPRGWKRFNKLSRVNQAVVRDLLITQEFVTLRPGQHTKQAPCQVHPALSIEWAKPG